MADIARILDKILEFTDYQTTHHTHNTPAAAGVSHRIVNFGTSEHRQNPQASQTTQPVCRALEPGEAGIKVQRASGVWVMLRECVSGSSAYIFVESQDLLCWTSLQQPLRSSEYGI